MRYLRSILCGVLGAMALTFVSAAAHADALPPDTAECDPNGHPGASPDPTKIGTTCALAGGGQGTCHCSVCSVLDYSDAGPDAHGPIGSIQFACLECKPGKQTNCSSCDTIDAGNPSVCVDTDAGPDAVGDAGADAMVNSSGNDPASTGGNTSSGGCSIGGSASAAAPWLLAGIVPIVFRRRRRSE